MVGTSCMRMTVIKRLKSLQFAHTSQNLYQLIQYIVKDEGDRNGVWFPFFVVCWIKKIWKSASIWSTEQTSAWKCATFCYKLVNRSLWYEFAKLYNQLSRLQVLDTLLQCVKGSRPARGVFVFTLFWPLAISLKSLTIHVLFTQHECCFRRG